MVLEVVEIMAGVPEPLMVHWVVRVQYV